MDIISRAAPVSAVERVFLLIDLCKGRLYKGRRRTDQRDHPHPEYGSRAARGDCSHHADQVAHPHTACGRYDQRLYT